MKSLKTVLALALAAALVLSLNLTAFAESLPIGIPDDGTNLSRGIKLLETAGLITVDPEAGYTPEIADITGYLYDNGTYAIPFGLIPSRDGLIIEKQSEEGDNPYVNIIAARTEDAENELYQTIVKAYQTQAVAEFLLVNYEEAFYPAFEYDEKISLTKEDAQEIVEYSSPKKDKTVVKVGVCGANNDQWQAVQKVLDEENAGIYIELVEFDAYNLPNEALNAGEIDLNAFQHKAYLKNDAEANGYDVVAIGDTLIAPLTLYSEKFDSLDALKDAAGKLG